MLNQALPPTGHPVVAVCKRFQQLAFLDGNRIWRDAIRPADELADVLGWFEV